MFTIIKNTFKNYTKEMNVVILLSVVISITGGISVLILIPMLDVININSTDIGVLSPVVK